MRALLVAAICLAILSACGDDDDNGEPAPGGSSTPRPTATAGSPTPSTTTAPATGPASPPTTTAPSSAPTPAPTSTPPTSTYTVQPGDTLYSIAGRFGTTVAANAGANGITDPSLISVGQVLIIPGGGPIPTQPPPTQPPSGAPATVLRLGDTSQRTVAFTFDAGSDAGYTIMILDTLAANGITASFGMTGTWAEKYPDLLRRIVNDGHSLINHSYTHASFTGNSTGAAALTQAQRWDELDRTGQIVRDLTGATTLPYFRPPYGDYDASVNADVGARGYSYNVMWTVDSRGWQGLAAPLITQRCTDLAEPGAIYVLHVGSASQDGPALQGIIDGLRAAGYAIADMDAVLP